MIKIGVVGDIGSGKTFVANSFGYPVFNADLEVAKIYKKDKKIDGTKIYYSNGKLEVGESRITHPIWEYRELDQTKTNILPLNPQENTELSFNHNLNTRLLQMDDYNSNNNNI